METESVKKVKKLGKSVLHWFEISLAVLVLIAVVVVAIRQIGVVSTYDWTSIESFLDVLKVVLQLAIGIEVARLLLSYNLNTIIELAVFIVARKMLLIEENFFGLLMGIVGLVLLFGARHFFIDDDKRCEKLEAADI